VFRIKICGITNIDDALHAAACGADALGLNFYSRSSRFLEIPRATEIAAAVRTRFPRVELVGVGVNASLEDVRQITAAVPLDAWQLHGDEPPEFLLELAKRLPQLRLIRAFRCRNADLAEESSYLQSCQTLGRLPDAVLLDAYDPSAYGGTGKVVDWHAVREQRAQLFQLPLILAGGLTPENVATALEASHADAVDVASGVEASPGKKDPEKVRAFIAAARARLAK
jgi:phosphoribosylanthranilate isomerase